MADSPSSDPNRDANGNALFHCPANLTGGSVAREHPLHANIDCPSGTWRLLARDPDYVEEASVNCGGCHTEREAASFSFGIISTATVRRNGGGPFRFNRKGYNNWDGYFPGNGAFRRHRNNSNLCSAFFGGIYHGETRECYCPSGQAPSLAHGRCEACTEYQTYENPMPGNRTGRCLLTVPGDCGENTEFEPAPSGEGGSCEECAEGERYVDPDNGEGSGSCVPRTDDNCPDNHEFRAAPGGGVCAPCMGDQVSTGGAACACLGITTANPMGYCTSSHQACYDADFRRPIAIDTSIAYARSNCRAAQNSAEDIAVCRTLDEDGDRNFYELGGGFYFQQVLRGSCAQDEDNACDAERYLMYPESANAGRDVGTCVSEQMCLDAGRYPEARTEGGNICRPLPSNSAECQGGEWAAENGVEPIYDAGEPDYCRGAASNLECVRAYPTLPIRRSDGSCDYRNAGDCADDHEFMANESGSGGTCHRCDANEVSRNGAACECQAPYYEAPAACRLPENNSECAQVDPNTPFFTVHTANQCRETEVTDCADDFEFVPEAGSCRPCPPNEFSFNGRACSPRNAGLACNAGIYPGIDPHTLVSVINTCTNTESLDTNPDSPTCGGCREDRTCPISYTYQSDLFCGTSEQLAAIGGDVNCRGDGRRSASVNCICEFQNEDVNAHPLILDCQPKCGAGQTRQPDNSCLTDNVEVMQEHHQRCYDDDFRTPIAVTVFAEEPSEGDCRPAVDGALADHDICDALDPGGMAGGNINFLYWIVDGACAANRRLTDCGRHSTYIISLEDAEEGGDVWLCFSANECSGRGWFYGTSVLEEAVQLDNPADTEYNRCYPDPENDAGCAAINRNTPYYDSTAPSRCRLPRMSSECEAVNENMPIFDESDPTNCRTETLAECEGNEFLSGGRCTECPADQVRGPENSCAPCPVENEVRAIGDASCSCPTDTHFPRNEETCEERISASSCPGNSHADEDENRCEECPENQIRGDSGSCIPCPVENEMRAISAAECSCPLFSDPADGSCVPYVECSGEQVLRQSDNTCADTCGDNEEIRDGACTCAEGFDRVAGVCERECSSAQIRVNGLGDCVDRVSCTGGAVSPANECECPPADDHVNGACLTKCGDHETRVDGVCTCPDTHFGSAGSCAPIRDPSDCAPNEHVVENECEECPVNQFRGDGSSCTACPPNETRAAGAASCACPRETHYSGGGACVPHIVCGQNEFRNPADNTCASNCSANEDLVNGVCQCRGSQVRANGAGECADQVSCAGGEVTEANTCQCPDGQEEVSGTCLQECHENAERQEAECICNADYEGDGFSCAACQGGKTSVAGEACACPNGQEEFTTGCAVPETCDGGSVLGRDNICADSCPVPLLNVGGICEASLAGDCREPYAYNAAENRCDCPSGQQENADQTACETIPAASSGGGSGGGGGGGGGAAAALIAVPAVLIGGYWLLGGFGYIDPSYGLDYSGENGDLDWRGNAGFNLQHGGLRSYASAVQSNGDAVSYESGISFERDFLSLSYDATESESEYLYDLGARLKAEFGAWTIAPAAAAEFQYRTGEEEWDSDASAGLEAAWTAHKWIVRGRSDFAGENRHRLEIQRDL